MPKRKYYGPYRVLKDAGGVYEVVALFRNVGFVYEDLRPRYTTACRQQAYRKCARLNKIWCGAINDPILLEYWKQAKN